MDKLKCISIIFLIHGFTVHNVSTTLSNSNHKFSNMYGDNLNSYWNRIKIVDEQSIVEEDMSSYVMENGVDSDLVNKKILSFFLTNLTSECERDFTRYQDELGKRFPAEWAVRMADSDGKTGAGVLDGHTSFEGSYPECVAIKEPDSPLVQEPIRPKFCFGFWFTLTFGLPGGPVPLPGPRLWARGQGICIPNTCDETDAEILLRNVYAQISDDVALEELHCVHDVPYNAEAIITIFILSMFGAMMVVGTFYDWNFRRRYANRTQKTTTSPTGATKTDTSENGLKSAVESPDVLVEGGCVNTGYVECKDGTEKNNGGIELSTVTTSNEAGLNSSEHNVKTFRSSSFVETSSKSEIAPPKKGVFGKMLTTFSIMITLPDLVSAKSPKGSYGCLNGLRVLAAIFIVFGHTWSLGPDGPNIPGIFGRMLTTFSIMVTIPNLVSAKAPKGSLSCLNGLRFLATMFIVFGHTWNLGANGPNVPENLYPYANDVFRNDWAMYKMITFDIYVDTFFILSAFLATLSFLRKLKKNNGIGKIGFKGMAIHYFQRYWRLTPTLMIILMVYTNLWHYFGKGPYMFDNKEDADSCSDVWWRNMLYINNFWYLFDVVPGCMGWTWYLAVDWQMFVIAPLFIYVFYRNKIAGSIFTFLGFAGGITANVVLWHKRYFPEEGEDPVNEFTQIYVPTWTRCTTYFMGIMLGYWVNHKGTKVRMPKVLVILGWLVALSMHVLVTYLPYLEFCTGSEACGQWSDEATIAWETLKRPMWGLWICWVIWACLTGYGAFVNTFLSWNFFVPLAKLSYAVYLIHPILCYLFWDRHPNGFFVNTYFAVYLFIGHLIISHFLSFIVTAAASNPLSAIANIFLPKK